MSDLEPDRRPPPVIRNEGISMSSIHSRKREHLRIVSEEQVDFDRGGGFERWRFIPNALPELDLAEVDTRTEFLGYKLKQPFMIGAISGGDSQSLELNRALARAAQQARVPLVLGSMRILLEDEAALPSFAIARETAPDIPIIANIGAVQLLAYKDMERLLQKVQALGADALSVHLNPLQEALQPEGQPHFRNVSRAIEILQETFPLPLIIKEVGCGLSFDVLKRLSKIGIKWVDVAGAGGTCWAKVECMRIKDESAQALAQEFFDWGLPTAEIVAQARELGNLSVIASGGIDDGMKYAKAIALGAELASAAGVFVRAWQKHKEEGILAILEHFQRTLQLAMFLTGCRTLKKFRGNPGIIERVNINPQ